MPLHQNILVATAFSLLDKKVVSRAVALAKQNQAKLTVLTIAPQLPAYMATALTSISDLENHFEEENFAQLKQLQKTVDYPTNYILKRGTPAEEIVSVAKSIKADLIVVGSHGSHGVQILLGSTSSSIIHRADCDVMVIRAPKRNIKLKK